MTYLSRQLDLEAPRRHAAGFAQQGVSREVFTKEGRQTMNVGGANRGNGTKIPDLIKLG